MPFDDRELRNGYNDVLLDLSVDSPFLTIMFAGMNRRLYELDRFTGVTNKIYLRDRHYTWYQCGVASVSNSVDRVVDHLQEHIYRLQPEQVILMGNSSGGTAALLFACLLGRNSGVQAHAFSPQTFINPIRRSRHGDHRWLKALTRRTRKNPLYPLQLMRLLRTSYTDVFPLINGTRLNIYYAQQNPIDRVHAERLAARPGVFLHAVDYARHDIVRHLTSTRQLEQIFSRIYGLTG